MPPGGTEMKPELGSNLSRERPMRVLLDERPCDVNADSVMEAIAAAASIAEERGRLVVEVMVDGRTWSSQELDSSNQQAPIVADEVRLTSANPLELVKQTLADASDALADADSLQQSAAQLLQAGQAADAMRNLGEALSIWSSVQQAMTMGCELANVDLNQIGGSDRGDSSIAAIEKLNAQLRSVHTALGNGDTVALSDTLLYELPQAVLLWRALLNAISQSIQIQQRDQD
jgi:hypothetical protein